MDEMQLTQRDKKLLELATKGGTDKELVLLEQMNELEDKFDSTVAEIKKSVPDLDKVLAAVKGTKGDAGTDGLTGENGSQGEQGPPGTPGKDGKNGKDGKDGREGRDGRDGANGRDGVDGVNGENGQDGSPDTPDEVVQKINQSKLLISKERVDGLMDALSQMVHSAVGITTTIFFSNGTQVGRAKNINFTGSAVSSVAVSGDTATVTLTGGTGGGGSFLTPTGTVNGVNAVFAVASQPTMVMTEKGPSVEGFGYSYAGGNITLDIPPQDWIKYM